MQPIDNKESTMMKEIDTTEEDDVIGGLQWPRPGECDPLATTGPTFPPWPSECPWW